MLKVVIERGREKLERLERESEIKLLNEFLRECELTFDRYLRCVLCILAESTAQL